MTAIGPVHLKQRRESCVLVFLRCACGYRERWPVPLTVSTVGRCTCPKCGGQLHEDREPAQLGSERLR
jgi:hypothetical protein